MIWGGFRASGLRLNPDQPEALGDMFGGVLILGLMSFHGYVMGLMLKRSSTDLTRKIEAATLHEHGPPTGMHPFEGLLDSCVAVEV